MASEEMISEEFFSNLAFWLPWQPIKFRGLDIIVIFGRRLIAEFLSDWDKKHCYLFPLPTDAICEIW